MSATEKTFTVAGTAINADGTVKARFANDLVARIKILNKAGCTEINLVELPRAMTKMEALKYMDSLKWDGDDGYAVSAKLYEKMKEIKKGEYKKEISIAEIRSRKVDVTPVEILEQTGFVDVDCSELELED